MLLHAVLAVALALGAAFLAAHPEFVYGAPGESEFDALVLDGPAGLPSP